jgi:hypothetical protein
MSAFAGKNVELTFYLVGEVSMMDSISFEDSSARVLQFTKFVRAGNDLKLDCSPSTGPYLLQKKRNLTDTNWINVVTTSNTSVTVPRVGQVGFFRVMDHATNNVSQLTG